ncbi:hypothetical protein SteCoe_10795 [Stentor coeruleus]|uniref:Uncharacterized protein n=1 Tax=Stentor coeruleus TaxID=5963 RepID=A0A1R2CEL3_9CILI|nr:hypothetical protein SteCoe_10795 [Stentor coeruleus]
MRKTETQAEKNRCQSTNTSNNSFVSSILKSPERSKLKHQRSVRFKEPDSPTNNEESFDVTPASLPQNSNSPKNTFSSYASPSKKTLSEYSPTESSVKKTHNPSKSTIVTSDNPGQIKIIKIAKLQKAQESSISPKFQPRTLSYDFRNQDFYHKLNKFISGRPAGTGVSADFSQGKYENSITASREKSANASFVHEEKQDKPLKAYANVNKSFESPVSVWTPSEGRSPVKKNVKPNIPVGKRPTTSINLRYSKASGPNVLN